MSPPEVWGPAVWTLFHCLAEKLHPNAFHDVLPSLFNIVVQICKALPCPDCSRDASAFLAKIQPSQFKNKTEFKNMLYLFHNYVNTKKRKPLYNYVHLDKYEKMNLPIVINDFMAKYNTRGNMKLLMEAFQRGLVVKNFVAWFNHYKMAFVTPILRMEPIAEETKESETKEEVEETKEEVEETKEEVEETKEEVEETKEEVEVGETKESIVADEEPEQVIEIINEVKKEVESVKDLKEAVKPIEELYENVFKEHSVDNGGKAIESKPKKKGRKTKK